MNYKTTIVLLIALAAVVGVMFFTRDSGNTAPVDKADASKLIQMASTEVQRLVITPAGQKKMVFVRSDNVWNLVEPVKAPADDSAVRNLLTDLVNLRPGTPVDVSSGSGLQSPRFVVELTDQAGKTATLRVGERSAIGQELYVQLEGAKQGNLVAAGVDESLDRPLAEFRDTKLLTLARDDIRRITIERPDGQLSMSRDGETWKITSPQEMPGDASAIGDLLFSLSTLRATEFVEGDPASPRFGLTRDMRKLTVSTQAGAATQPATQPAGQTVTLLVGLPDDVQQKRLFAMVEGSGEVAKIAADSLSFLDRSAMELRDKQVLRLDPASVNRLKIEINRPATTQPTTKPAEKQVAEVTRRSPPATQPVTQPATQPAGTWITAAGSPANDGLIDAVLTAMNPLKVSKFVNTGPSSDGATITVTIQAGGEGVRPLREERLQFLDRGADQPPIGVYNALSFEVDRSLIDKLQARIDDPTARPADSPVDLPVPLPE